MAISNPTLVNYKPFYIQYGNNNTASDTLATWGLIAKTNPYAALPSPKEVYSNDWHDVSGSDEYNSTMYFESFEISVDFYIRATGLTAAADIRGNISTFFNAIKQGEFKIYDSYTALGRQKVRYAGYEEKEFKERKNTAKCIFTIKFKVNDPVTFMKLNSNNQIVTV